MSLIKPSGKLFKHDHIFTGYAGGPPYLTYKSNNPYTDGINRGHVALYGRCDICGVEIQVANIHTDADGKLYEMPFDKQQKDMIEKTKSKCTTKKPTENEIRSHQALHGTTGIHPPFSPIFIRHSNNLF